MPEARIFEGIPLINAGNTSGDIGEIARPPLAVFGPERKDERRSALEEQLGLKLVPAKGPVMRSNRLSVSGRLLKLQTKRR